MEIYKNLLQIQSSKLPTAPLAAYLLRMISSPVYMADWYETLGEFIKPSSLPSSLQLSEKHIIIKPPLCVFIGKEPPGTSNPDCSKKAPIKKEESVEVKEPQIRGSKRPTQMRKLKAPNHDLKLQRITGADLFTKNEASSRDNFGGQESSETNDPLNRQKKSNNESSQKPTSIFAKCLPTIFKLVV